MIDPVNLVRRSIAAALLLSLLLASCAEPPVVVSDSPAPPLPSATSRPAEESTATSLPPAPDIPTSAPTSTTAPLATSTLAPENAAGNPGLQPLVKDLDIRPDKWSLNRKYLSFIEWGKKNEAGSDRTSISLKFLNASTGQVCPALQEIVKFTGGEEIEMPARTAWLDDNRLLYVAPSGAVQAVTPCSDSTENFTLYIPDHVLSIATSSPDGTQVLFRGERAYWLFTPASYSVLQVNTLSVAAETLPVFAWSPSNHIVSGRVERRLGGPWVVVELIDPGSGDIFPSAEIEAGPTLEPASLSVKWMAVDRVALAYTAGSLHMALLDVWSQPAGVTDVFPGMLGGQVILAATISASGAISAAGEQDYHLYAFTGLHSEANLFLYHGESSRVAKTSLGLPALLVFPSGETAFLQLYGSDGSPLSSDIFLIMYADSIPDSAQLIISDGTAGPVAGSSIELMPGGEQVKVDSAQGIYLARLSSGAISRSWSTTTPAQIDNLYSIASPGGDAIIGFAHRLDSDEGSWEMYWIDLVP